MGSVLSDLDELIATAPVEERPGLVVQLAARLAMLGAQMVSLPPSPAEVESRHRNLSPKEAARKLGVSLPYLYKHADQYPFTRRFGKRKLVFDSKALEEWNLGQRPSKPWT